MFGARHMKAFESRFLFGWKSFFFEVFLAKPEIGEPLNGGNVRWPCVGGWKEKYNKRNDSKNDNERTREMKL